MTTHTENERFLCGVAARSAGVGFLSENASFVVHFGNPAAIAHHACGTMHSHLHV